MRRKLRLRVRVLTKKMKRRSNLLEKAKTPRTIRILEIKTSKIAMINPKRIRRQLRSPKKSKNHKRNQRKRLPRRLIKQRFKPNKSHL